jgi:hypothetical protein
VRKLSLMGLVEWFREFFIAKKDMLAPKTLWNFTMGVKALMLENDVKASIGFQGRLRGSSGGRSAPSGRC